MRWCADDDFLAIFLRPAFSASRVEHVSDLRLKFALRPHHVWQYTADIQSATAEIRRGEKKSRKNKRQDENIYGLLYYIVRS